MLKARTNSEQPIPSLAEIGKQQRRSLPGELNRLPPAIPRLCFASIWRDLARAETRRALSSYCVWIGQFDAVNLINFVVDARKYLQAPNDKALYHLWNEYLWVREEHAAPAVCAQGLYRIAGCQAMRAIHAEYADNSTQNIKAVLEHVECVIKQRFFNPEKPRTEFLASAHAQALRQVDLPESLSARSCLKELERVEVPALEPGRLARLVRRYVLRPEQGPINPPRKYWAAKRSQCLQLALRCTKEWRSLRCNVRHLTERLESSRELTALSWAATLIKFANYLDTGVLEESSWDAHVQQLDAKLCRALIDRKLEQQFLVGVDVEAAEAVVDEELGRIRQELRPRICETRRECIGEIPKSVMLPEAQQKIGEGSSLKSIVRHVRAQNTFCLSAAFYVGDVRIQPPKELCSGEEQSAGLKQVEAFFTAFGQELLRQQLCTAGDAEAAARYLADPAQDEKTQCPSSVFYDVLLRASSVHAQFVVDHYLREVHCPALMDNTGRIKAWRRSEQTSFHYAREVQQHRHRVVNELTYEVYAKGQRDGTSAPLAVFKLEATFFIHGQVFKELQLRPHSLHFTGIEEDLDLCEELLSELEKLRV